MTQLSENIMPGKQISLHHIDYIMSFRHKLIYDGPVAPGKRVCRHKQAEILPRDCHRLVCEHIISSLDRLMDIFRLLHVVAGNHDHVPLAVRNHPPEIIIPYIRDSHP